jgi:cystathionine beta-synthase
MGTSEATVRDLLAGKSPNIVSTHPNERVRDVIATMKCLGISQLPVIEDGKLRGLVSEIDVLRHLIGGAGPDATIASLVEVDFATVTRDSSVSHVKDVLRDARVAIVVDGDRVVGLVTRIDLIDFLARA